MCTFRFRPLIPSEGSAHQFLFYQDNDAKCVLIRICITPILSYYCPGMKQINNYPKNSLQKSAFNSHCVCALSSSRQEKSYEVTFVVAVSIHLKENSDQSVPFVRSHRANSFCSFMSPFFLISLLCQILKWWTFLIHRKLTRWRRTLVDELGIVWDQLWTWLQSFTVGSVGTVQAVIHCCVGDKTTSFHNHSYQLHYFPGFWNVWWAFWSDSALTSLQVLLCCVTQNAAESLYRCRQAPCIKPSSCFVCDSSAPQDRSQMSSPPIWSSPTPQKEMCVSKSRLLHLADTACALTAASLMLGHP